MMGRVSTSDMKGWIQEAAYALALYHYGREYYSLPDRLQTQIYNMAEELWSSEVSDYNDRAVDDYILRKKEGEV
jgi:hypothetical protein